MSDECEVWDDVAGFEGSYAVSTLGRVFDFKRNYVRNPCTNVHGYKRVQLTNERMSVQVNVHELVAGTFIPTLDYTLDINHINGIRDDNRASNLRWCTHAESCRYATSITG